MQKEASPPGRGPQQFSTGLYDCCDDPGACCFGLLCPCVMFGQNVERLTGRACVGPCLLHCILGGGLAAVLALVPFIGPAAYWINCVSCYACGHRSDLRDKYDLLAEPCGDCVVHFCCHPCAICQEYRELKVRPPLTGGIGFYNGANCVELEPPGPQGMDFSNA
eukprot:TRINITY_DN10501_c0_g1_i1.p2 TRINITY_DN10501_c0_g1~~TRINITY_DN10501_c0_g1_i1.p2  ORF type:complete len:164 (-),score=10.69 TRINITY_DN10501_c0_g1_i1:888-1379(-)